MMNNHFHAVYSIMIQKRRKMKITVITVGKIKEKYLRDAIAEYTKRLSRYCRLEIVEVADEKTPDQASETVEDNIRAKEGERLMKYIRDDMYVITLEIGGKMLSSEEFAEKIETLGVQGKSSIAFVIGGSIGLGREVLKRSDFSASTDAGDTAGTGVSGVSDHEWRAISQINAVFSHVGVIWCEVINHRKYLEREWTDEFSLSFYMLSV